MVLIGILYASNAARTTTGQWAVIALIEIFSIAFAASWGPTIRIYAVEVQPPRTRAAAASFGKSVPRSDMMKLLMRREQGIACNQGTNTLVALTAPAFLAKSSSVGIRLTVP